jgi:hypothetical protein
MNRHRPFGVLLGLAGNVAIGFALYRLLMLGGCGEPGQPPCPEGPGMSVVLLPLGILVSVVSTFLGGGAISFLGTFLAVGVGALAAAARSGHAEIRGFATLFGGIFAGVPLLLVLLGLWLRRGAKAKRREAERLVRQGSTAIATVLEVRDTGVTINDDPRVALKLRIEPRDGAPAFFGEKAITVSRLSIPHPGDHFPVWYDPADPTKFGIGTEMTAAAPPEVQALFAAARQEAPVSTADPFEQIERLHRLHASGAITDAEYEATKVRLLARIGELPR